MAILGRLKFVIKMNLGVKFLGWCSPVLIQLQVVWNLTRIQCVFCSTSRSQPAFPGNATVVNNWVCSIFFLVNEFTKGLFVPEVVDCHHPIQHRSYNGHHMLYAYAQRARSLLHVLHGFGHMPIEDLGGGTWRNPWGTPTSARPFTRVKFTLSCWWYSQSWDDDGLFSTRTVARSFPQKREHIWNNARPCGLTKDFYLHKRSIPRRSLGRLGLHWSAKLLPQTLRSPKGSYSNWNSGGNEYS